LNIEENKFQTSFKHLTPQSAPASLKPPEGGAPPWQNAV